MDLNFRKMGDGPVPVLVLHGVFGSLDNWTTIGRKIADAGYTVYLLDQRNHGRSPHSDHLTYEGMAADLEALIVSEGLQSPVLIGHSMGGKTVLRYVAEGKAAARALVVVDIGPKPYPVHHTRLLEGLNSFDPAALQSRQEADDLLAVYEPSPAVRQFLLKNLYRTDADGFGWRFNLPVLTTDMPLVGEAVWPENPVTIPVLFIRGELSDYVLDEDLPAIREYFQDSRLETIPGAGHWVQAEQPAAFLSVVLDFLDSLPGG